nr:efflux RND transporter permease subunit [Thiorhodovibrio frisius]
MANSPTSASEISRPARSGHLIFGPVPLMLASGPDSEIQRPLAIVMIGGLLSSTTLTLIVLPMLYRRFGAN